MSVNAESLFRKARDLDTDGQLILRGQPGRTYANKTAWKQAFDDLYDDKMLDLPPVKRVLDPLVKRLVEIDAALSRLQTESANVLKSA